MESVQTTGSLVHGLEEAGVCIYRGIPFPEFSPV